MENPVIELLKIAIYKIKEERGNYHPSLLDRMENLIVFIKETKSKKTNHKKTKKGYIIKALRIKKGMTQSELGDVIGLTRARVCQYELNQAVASQVNRLKENELINILKNKV
jgi:DNA-binding XRE family transcriptional regulator